MKYQSLFSQKNNEKIFKTVVCCSRDWWPRYLRQRSNQEFMEVVAILYTVCTTDGKREGDFGKGLWGGRRGGAIRAELFDRITTVS